jgi:hypothetical protein
MMRELSDATPFRAAAGSHKKSDHQQLHPIRSKEELIKNNTDAMMALTISGQVLDSILKISDCSGRSRKLFIIRRPTATNAMQ